MLAGLLPLLALTAGGRQRGSPSLRFYTLDMCPYAQRVWILLEELGVPYERQPVNLRDAAQKEQYQREVNPRGKYLLLSTRRPVSLSTSHTSSTSSSPSDSLAAAAPSSSRQGTLYSERRSASGMSTWTRSWHRRTSRC